MSRLTLLLLLACSPKSADDTGVDTAQGATDDTADTTADDTGDTAADDTAVDDTGDTADTGDTGEEHTEPLDGYGDITGDCWVLDDEEWDSTSPFLFRGAIDVDGEPSLDLLTDGGAEVYTDGNLGGSSIWSEVFAFELLDRCEGAELLKTEGEVLYTDDGGKKTDLLVHIDALDVGVSVTRAYHYPTTEPYTLEDAESLLDKKLGDILLSADNADPSNAWARSVLYIIAYDANSADMIEQAWASLDASVADETIVFVTVSDGDDEFLY